MEENIPSYFLAPFVSIKRLARVQRRALRRPPLTTRCVVQYDPFPQGPCHIRSIAGGAHALDLFLATEVLSLPLTDTSVNANPRPPPIKRSSSTQAQTRTKRGKHPSPPPLTKGDKTQDHAPPTSPARQPRRPHNNLLHIITEEGDPDKDSTPGPKPHTSLVPPTSPWKTHGKSMNGVHSHTWGGHIPHPPISGEIAMVI
jgi:hypothetical protein